MTAFAETGSDASENLSEDKLAVASKVEALDSRRGGATSSPPPSAKLRCSLRQLNYRLAPHHARPDRHRHRAHRRRRGGGRALEREPGRRPGGHRLAVPAHHQLRRPRVDHRGPAHCRRPRTDASGGLSLPRKAPELRPRKDPGARRPCPRHRRLWLLRAVRPHGRLRHHQDLQGRRVQARDPHPAVPPSVNGPGLARLRGQRQGRAGLRSQVLHGGRKLGSGRQQHSRLLHPERHFVPRSRSCAEAGAQDGDAAGSHRARQLLGLHLAEAGEHAHGDVDTVGSHRPSHAAQHPGLRRAHVRPPERAGRRDLRQVPLDSRAGPREQPVGRAAEDGRQGPGFSEVRSRYDDLGSSLRHLCRRDFYDNINRGVFPAWEFGVQVVKPEDAEKFDFDLLDPTKIIPESLVTVHKIGRMVIDKAPDEFFTQVEQSGFAPSRVPPGITFSNDPMLQSRIFSYHDTQLHRMGPNFHLLPTNAPRCPFDNNQRDGFMAFKVNSSNVNYFPHGIDQGKGPKPVAEGAHQHSQLSTGLSSAVAGSQEDRMTTKVAARPTAKFSDHFSQATLFWNSLSEPEKNHLVAAAWFELGKCERMATRELMVGRFNHVDHELAKRVASGLGVAPPKQAAVKNHGQTTKGLSILEFRPKNVAGKKIAILVAEGVSGRQIAAFKAEVEKNGAVCEVISATFGPIKTVDGQKELVPDKMLIHVSSTFYDAVWVPGGTEMHIDALKRDGLAVHFINEQFKHCKPIAASGNGIDLLAASALPTIGLANSTSSTSPDEGVTSKIGASVSKVAQKAMWAMTAAVPESMEAEMGVLTSRSDDDASVRSIWGMLKDALIKGRTFQRENDPRVPA